jgi:PAS domain S-box-containing protein
MKTSSYQSVSEKELTSVSEELLKVMLDFKDYAIIVIDNSYLIHTWNLGAVEIFGYTNNEAIGKTLSEIFTCTGDFDYSHLQPGKADETGRYEAVGRNRRKDGTLIYVNTIITALYNDDRSIKGYAIVLRDISKEKLLEEENKRLTDQLEEKVQQRTKELAIVNQELEAFSYSVSHDLRTPLRAITGYAVMLKEDYEETLDAEANRIIDVIVTNTRLMAHLIDDLLTFSKMARLEVINDSVDMKPLVEKCVKEILKIESRKDYKISILPLPICKGDDKMLKQVWINLISNAIKYSSKISFPQLEVGAIEKALENIYYVKDNGTGFDMKYSNKLFGVFQRLHRQDEFEGTGLGLALAKRIISKHGGEIWAEASPGNGAIFFFSLPK